MVKIGSIQKLSDKGFGFIDFGEGVDIFFHATRVAIGEAFDDLRVGDCVIFRIEKSGPRPTAFDVEQVENCD